MYLCRKLAEIDRQITGDYISYGNEVPEYLTKAYNAIEKKLDREFPWWTDVYVWSM